MLSSRKVERNVMNVVEKTSVSVDSFFHFNFEFIILSPVDYPLCFVLSSSGSGSLIHFIVAIFHGIKVDLIGMRQKLQFTT